MMIYDLLDQAVRAAAVKQAEATRRAAEAVLAGDGDNTEVRMMKQALEVARKEAEAAKRELLILKKRSQDVARDYDKLVEIELEAKTEAKKRSVFNWRRN